MKSLARSFAARLEPGGGAAGAHDPGAAALEVIERGRLRAVPLDQLSIRSIACDWANAISEALSVTGMGTHLARSEIPPFPGAQ